MHDNKSRPLAVRRQGAASAGRPEPASQSGNRGGCDASGDHGYGSGRARQGHAGRGRQPGQALASARGDGQPAPERSGRPQAEEAVAQAGGMGAGFAGPADRGVRRSLAMPLRARQLPGQAVEGAVTSGSSSQEAQVSPSATITAGPVRRLAAAPGATASLPPGTPTVHSRRPLAGHSPAAPAAPATAPVPQDSVSPEPRSCTRISIA